MVHEDSLIDIINQDMCRQQVPLIVNVTAKAKNYEFIWYILISVLGVLIIGGIVYCVLKKKKLG